MRILPASNDRLNVSVDGVDIRSWSVSDVDNADDGLAMRSQSVDRNHSRWSPRCLAMSEMTAQVDEEIRVVPFL